MHAPKITPTLREWMRHNTDVKSRNLKDNNNIIRQEIIFCFFSINFFPFYKNVFLVLEKSLFYKLCLWFLYNMSKTPFIFI